MQELFTPTLQEEVRQRKQKEKEQTYSAVQNFAKENEERQNAYRASRGYQ